MPLVRIDLRRGKPAGYATAIGEAVHRAMVETIGVPQRGIDFPAPHMKNNGSSTNLGGVSGRSHR